MSAFLHNGNPHRRPPYSEAADEAIAYKCRECGGWVSEWYPATNEPCPSNWYDERNIAAALEAL